MYEHNFMSQIAVLQSQQTLALHIHIKRCTSMKYYHLFSRIIVNL